MASLPKACVDAANVGAAAALPDFGLSYTVMMRVSSIIFYFVPTIDQRKSYTDTQLSRGIRHFEPLD